MTYFNSYYIIHPYIQHWLIYLWQIYRYVNGTKLAFHYMIISLEPFFRKIASFPLFAMQSSAINIFSIPYRRASFFLFFVWYRIRSPEVNIPLLLLWFLLSPLNYIILKNRSYQWGSCDHSFYRSQWVEQKLKCNLCSKFHILATSVDEPIPA